MKRWKTRKKKQHQEFQHKSWLTAPLKNPLRFSDDNDEKLKQTSHPEEQNQSHWPFLQFSLSPRTIVDVVDVSLKSIESCVSGLLIEHLKLEQSRGAENGNTKELSCLQLHGAILSVPSSQYCICTRLLLHKGSILKSTKMSTIFNYHCVQV